MGPRDYPLQSCSSNPATGYVRQCADQTTGNLICVNALGGSCNPTTTIASGSMGLPTTAIPANSCGTAVTTTASGVLPTDTVAWSFNSDVTGLTGWSGAIQLRVWASANTVNVKLCNTTGASVTPGAVSINWSIPGRSPNPTVPTVQHHSTGGCTGGATTCTLTGQVVGSTGNAVVLQAFFCWNSSCTGTVTPACGYTVADGTNTYAAVTSSTFANSTSSNTAVTVFVAGNATAGTYSVTLTVTGTGCSINFGALWFVDVGPAATSPVDVSMTNVTSNNTGTAIALNSIGNAAYSNELALALGTCNSNQAITSAGSFIMLDRTSSTYYSNFYQPGIAVGSPGQFTATCAATSIWVASLVGLHN